MRAPRPKGTGKGKAGRSRARARVPTPRPPQAADSEHLVHELKVHQVELEMQNEELRRTKAELELNRDLYWTLYNRAPFGYLTLEVDGAICAANPAAVALLRLDREKLIGRHLSQFMGEADADRFQTHRRQVLADETRQSCDLRLRRPDGSQVEVRMETALDSSVPGPRLITVVVDVSDLRRAQDDLRESEARFRQIAESIADVFYVRELDGRVSYVSPAFERIWGRPADWLRAQPAAWMETIDPEDRNRVAVAWLRMRGGASISEVYRICRPDGTQRWVHSRGFAVVADGGEVRRNVGVVRDVTNERKLEDELRQAQKMEAVGTLAGGLAHNLRNVLQAIVASVGLVKVRGSGSPEGVRSLERALSASGKGVALIDQLMVFSRKQSGQLTRRPLRLDQEVHAAEALIKVLLGERIQLDVATGAPGGVVMADPVQLEQILLNLATNARDAMPDGGTVTIQTRERVLDDEAAKSHGVVAGPHVVVTVRDTGTGMDAATKARVFEPFFTTKEAGKGTGLGLSTVFGLVRQFGGCVDVESEPGAGTTFSICFPSLQGPIASAG
jgi:PAS domain S-box-containing protein